MYMEKGKRANALGMDSFDRMVETWGVDLAQEEADRRNIEMLCSDVSLPTPLTYTTCTASNSLSDATNAINSITLDGNKLAIRDTVAVAGIDKLKDETEKLSAAIKNLGKIMGVDPFKNSKIDFEEYIRYGDRLRRSELKTI